MKYCTHRFLLIHRGWADVVRTKPHIDILNTVDVAVRRDVVRTYITRAWYGPGADQTHNMKAIDGAKKAKYDCNVENIILLGDFD